MARRPPRIFCRDCGADLGRGWSEAPLCDNCKGERLELDTGCVCSYPDWDTTCPIHQSHNPYDIPF